MDARHIFAVFAGVFCIVLILATVTGYRHLFEQVGYNNFSTPLTACLPSWCIVAWVGQSIGPRILSLAACDHPYG